MSRLLKRLKELKKTDPLFKDFDLTPHYNNLDDVKKHIEELFKNEPTDTTNESNNNSEESSK